MTEKIFDEGREKMDNDNIIILNDDEGNETEFEFLDLIPYRGKEYVVLLPSYDDADEVVILQLEEVDDEAESYISVDNELTLQAVFEIFKEKAKDEFNFVD
jgi:hypothetical protein